MKSLLWQGDLPVKKLTICWSISYEIFLSQLLPTQIASYHVEWSMENARWVKVENSSNREESSPEPAKQRVKRAQEPRDRHTRASSRCNREWPAATGKAQPMHWCCDKDSYESVNIVGQQRSHVWSQFVRRDVMLQHFYWLLVVVLVGQQRSDAWSQFARHDVMLQHFPRHSPEPCGMWEAPVTGELRPGVGFTVRWSMTGDTCCAIKRPKTNPSVADRH